MILETIIVVVGLSHVIQAPATWLLARELRLAEAFSRLPPLPGQVARNMGIASVYLPTALGLVIALHAKEVTCGGAPRLLACIVAAFWSWRLVRQVSVLRPLWPTSPKGLRRWNWVLTAIFVVQGPMLAVAVVLAAWTRE